MTLDYILRLPVVEQAVGKKHSRIYKDVEEELFPKPVRISSRAVGWPASEVAAINQARIAGKSDDEIRALVRELHRKRTRS